VTKPFQLEEVHARLETHLNLRRLKQEVERHNRRLEHKVEAYAQEIIASQMATIFALAKLAESRDDYTGSHLERVQLYCRLLAERLAERSPYRQEVTPEFIENIHHASPLHDIGKVAIADSILLKRGTLTAEEFSIMQTHTLIGARTLASVLERYPQNVFVRTGLTIARSHHERWGEEISLYARVMAVADVYDALRSERCYRAALPHEEAHGMIMEGSGTRFDPAVVAVYEEISDEFMRISQELASAKDTEGEITDCQDSFHALSSL
jgi:putative two-component system response regulator